MNALTFPGYVDNVLKPIVNGTGSNGELAVFLNRQLDEWELVAERPEGEPIAPLVIDALEQIIDALERAPADLDAWRKGLGAIAA
jgi:hypothetical protein